MVDEKGECKEHWTRSFCPDRAHVTFTHSPLAKASQRTPTIFKEWREYCLALCPPQKNWKNVVDLNNDCLTEFTAFVLILLGSCQRLGFFPSLFLTWSPVLACLDAITKYHRLADSIKRHLFSYSFGGWKSTIKVLAGLAFRQTSLLGLPFLCVLT